ncbi:hypothetical protein GMORB2_3905 [Geosmithia morbida]|uniref:Uncharacterized protein n=1 Tax=Geosmithia morbida TaxID=1094350 RepID=A0A9P4Z0A5_9HYPO|nr:uncharacterized protein GMORB2_3905 [Geosmithia morbida]KAF4125066.1 hypothetical protein GMORB2_3905 [Geosmithia morbida]
MAPFSAPLQPGLLGASLHDVLTRLKAEPQRFPKLDVLYSADRPVTEPVCVNLPQNGLRLRFDGPEQRLRLIEVVDFTNILITYKDREVVRPQSPEESSPSAAVVGAGGPTFRHIYHHAVGPTYGGEFIHPPAGQNMGIYVLSYPGVAFNFSLPASAYSPDKDVVALMASAPSQLATSMAVFSGSSWAEARPTLWTETLPSVKVSSLLPRSKDVYPDEVSLVRVRGGGRIDMFRKWTANQFHTITLGETTPQDLVRELGPPSAIYRKSEQKMGIHKMRAASTSRSRPSAGSMGTGRPEDLTDTDRSSTNTTGSDDDAADADDDEDDDDGVSHDDVAVDDTTASSSIGNPAGECFYNYFHLGFDVLLSTPVNPSPAPTQASAHEQQQQQQQNDIKRHSPDRLVATKLVLHGNVPGSYEFNRHRRCRWEIDYLGDGSRPVADSEATFEDIEDRMNDVWGPDNVNGNGGHKVMAATTRQESSHQHQRQRGMVLNRGWDDSPGSSCELLGGWEESGARRVETVGDSTTTLYGFPGLVFEVLKNGYVNAVTVF